MSASYSSNIPLIFDIHDKEASLSDLVELVESGEIVQIGRNGRPVVELHRLETGQRPKFGEFEPLDVSISDDFDDPVPEWEASMTESEEPLDEALSKLTSK